MCVYINIYIYISNRYIYIYIFISHVYIYISHISHAYRNIKINKYIYIYISYVYLVYNIICMLLPNFSPQLKKKPRSIRVVFFTLD